MPPVAPACDLCSAPLAPSSFPVLIGKQRLDLCLYHLRLWCELRGAQVRLLDPGW